MSPYLRASPAVRADFRLLRRRRFVLLFTARTVSVLGNAVAPVALAFGVLGLAGATPVALSIVLAAQTLPRLVLMLGGGVIADRWPRHRVLVGAETLGGAAYLGIASMLVSGWAPVTALALCAALAGTATAVFLPALTGVVTEIVETHELTEANGLLRLGGNAARVTGFALAGALVGLIGAGWTLIFDAATYLVSAGLLLALRLPGTAHTTSDGLLTEMRQGWQEFAGRQWLWVIVLAAACINAAFLVSLNLVGPIVAQRRLGGAPGWSVVLAAYGIGSVLGVFVAMRLRPRRPLVTVAVAALPLGLPALALGMHASLATVVFAAAAAGVAMDVFSVVWDTTVQREIPREVISRVSAYEWVGATGLAPIGMVVAGPLVVRFGADTVLLALAAVVGIASPTTLCAPQVRRLGSHG